MNTPNTNLEPSEGLRAKVEVTREKAREILRAKMISNRIQKIFSLTSNLKQYENAIILDNRVLARAKYGVTKLDKENPDYEQLLKEATEYLETQTINFNNSLKQIEKDNENTNKNIDTLNAEISDIEAGKMKVNIDEVKSISDNLILTDL